MTTGQQAPPPSPLGPLGPLARYEKNLIDRIADFNDPRQEWRRLFSELLGTFFLVLAAAGGGMMGHAFPGVISHGGKISGAHLNPAVSIAFALRRDFPWWRVPGYVITQPRPCATISSRIRRASQSKPRSWSSSRSPNANASARCCDSSQACRAPLRSPAKCASPSTPSRRTSRRLTAARQSAEPGSLN
jgi:hypothetical protein